MRHNKLWKRAALFGMVAGLMASSVGCGGKDKDDNGKTPVAADIVNGDFEELGEGGKWVGWTKADAAFNVRGIVSSEKLRGVTMEKSGNSFFSGTDGGNQVMRGTLTSDVFTLGGTGYITFKMGAGKNTDKVYVEFFEDGNETAIARVANEDCDGIFITDHLITKVVDLSAYIGKNIYIKVTDNDDGNDLSYVNLDAFRVCQSMDEVNAAKDDYARQIAEYGEKPFVEDETSHDIQNGGFETGDLSGWKILSGNAITGGGIVPTSQYYWTDRSVYGNGNYYFDGSNNGATVESAVGAIRSSKFTLAGDGYISFMIGAAPRDTCYVAVCDGNTDEELIKVGNAYFSDPALALTLLRVYVDAGDYIGKVLYIKVVDGDDGTSGGFAFMNVDDFRVSLTKQEVAALQTEQVDAVRAETYTSASYDDLASLLNYYNNYPYPVALESLSIREYAESIVVDAGYNVDLTAYLVDVKAVYGETEVTDIAIKGVRHNETEYKEGFTAFDLSEGGYYYVTYAASYEDKTVEAEFTVVSVDDHRQVPNGGFESGDLTGWTVLTDGWRMVEGKAAGVISATDYWGEKMPYNQEGNYHLDGWNNGLDEGATWKVQSDKFTLDGSGFISVKMGGHAAAVRVFLADGTQVGYYKQNRFNDSGFPSLAGGGSWADMATYVMDLSAYLGEEMYVVLCDEQVDGWAHAFFDDVVTYYETAPDYENLADTVMDGAEAGEVQIPWRLVESN